MRSAVGDGAPPAIQDQSPALDGQYNSKITEGMSGLTAHTSGSLVIPAATAPVRPSTPTYSLGDLQTEQKNANSAKVDVVSTLDLCRMLVCPRNAGIKLLTDDPGIINDEDATVSKSVQTCLPLIATAIDIIVPRLLIGGRVVYTGAGTSGR